MTPLPPDLTTLSVENARQASGLAEWQLESVSDLAWTPDGRLLVVSNLSQILFYEPLSRQVIRTLYPRTQPIIDLAFSPLNTWLVSASRRGSEEQGYVSQLELWQGPDWKPRGILYDIPMALSDVSFSPDGRSLVAAYSSPIVEYNSLHFWDVTVWQITETLQTGMVLNIAFSPDGGFIAASPDQYALRIFDISQREWLYNMPTSFTGAVNQFTFSPDGSVLASGHYDGVIRLWDMETGEMILEIQSKEVIESLAFSPDGRLLASGGSYENSQVRLWDTATGELLRSLEGHSSGVSQLLFSPTAQFLVSGSYDGSVRIWGIRP